jgi:hypothetical protein
MSHAMKGSVAVVVCLAGLAACGGGDEEDTGGTTLPPAPTLAFSASVSSVPSGGSATLNWSTTNATECTASGGWSGTKAAQGSESTGAITTARTYTLACTGLGGSVTQSVDVTITGAAAPTLTLTANPTTVASGGTTTLTWSSTNATSCTASGGWTGSRATSGSQASNALTANTTFTLQCSGNGGSIQRQATVTVSGTQPPPAPTLTFSANPASVASGEASTLTWSSTNATSCTASNGWTGSKPTQGTESTGALSATRTFALACTGAGGNVSRSVTVTVAVAGAGLSGTVDSSFVRASGDTRVYVFSGNVTPGSSAPLATIPVVQDANACTFRYGDGSIGAGTYTVAVADASATSLTYAGSRVVTVAASGTASNFTPARVLRVGATQQYPTLFAAHAAAQDGDVIEVDPETYLDDVVVWRRNRLTIRGVNGRPHQRGTQVITFVSGDDRRNGMGINVTRGNDIRLENFEISGARVTDLNGAGIRVQSRNLTVCNVHFHDNQDGMLGEATGTLIIEYSQFNANGAGDPGFNHNVYVSGGDKLVFRHNYSTDSNVGHTLKTRAAENHILYNRLTTEDGRTSYEIDVPEGGLTYIVGNLIQQGENSDNSSMVAYGAEGLSGGRTHNLYLVNNTLVNEMSGGRYVSVAGGTAVLRSINNLFVGAGTMYSGRAADATADLRVTATDLVDASNYDYRLRSTSSARDAGVAPGSVGGVNLTPVFHYSHPATRTARPVSGAMDVGAYEAAP